MNKKPKETDYIISDCDIVNVITLISWFNDYSDDEDS